MKYSEFKKAIKKIIESQECDDKTKDVLQAHAAEMYSAFYRLRDDAEVRTEVRQEGEVINAKDDNNDYNFQRSFTQQYLEFKAKVAASLKTQPKTPIFEALDMALAPLTPQTVAVLSVAHEAMAKCLLNPTLLQRLSQEASSPNKRDVTVPGKTAEGDNVPQRYALSKPLASVVSNMNEDLGILATLNSRQLESETKLAGMWNSYLDLRAWLTGDAKKLLAGVAGFGGLEAKSIAESIQRGPSGSASDKLCAKMYLMLDSIFKGRQEFKGYASFNLDNDEENVRRQCADFETLVGSMAQSRSSNATHRSSSSTGEILGGMHSNPAAQNAHSSANRPRSRPASINFNTLFDELKESLVNQALVESLETKHRPAGKSVQIDNNKSKRISDTLADIINLLQKGKQANLEDKKALMEKIYEKVRVWLQDRAPELKGIKETSNSSEVSQALIEQARGWSSTMLPKKEHYIYAVIFDSLDKAFGGAKVTSLKQGDSMRPLPIQEALAIYDGKHEESKESSYEAGPNIRPRR